MNWYVQLDVEQKQSAAMLRHTFRLWISLKWWQVMANITISIKYEVDFRLAYFELTLAYAKG